MPTFPTTPPFPSHISAPALIDPSLTFTTDQGYEMRRALHSRPRRRYLMEWLGKTTEEMRIIRDFVQEVRLGTLEFDWYHMTATELATVGNTTPITLTYQHGLLTGQWLLAGSGTPAGINGVYQITRVSSTVLTLNGTTALGTGTVSTRVYLPRAVLRFANETFEAPTKLIGPEAVGGTGRFSWALLVEEVF